MHLHQQKRVSKFMTLTFYSTVQKKITFYPHPPPPLLNPLPPPLLKIWLTAAADEYVDEEEDDDDDDEEGVTDNDGGDKEVDASMQILPFITLTLLLAPTKVIVFGRGVGVVGTAPSTTIIRLFLLRIALRSRSASITCARRGAASDPIDAMGVESPLLFSFSVSFVTEPPKALDAFISPTCCAVAEADSVGVEKFVLL